MILVTHDEKVAAHAERIIEMRDGEIIADRVNTDRPIINEKTTERLPTKPGQGNRLMANIGLFQKLSSWRGWR